MIDESIDVIGTFLVLVAPFALALFVIVLVIAYPWLLLIPLGIGYLVVKYGSDEVPPAKASSTLASAADAVDPDTSADAEASEGTRAC